ncbi:MAG: hypothetical protein AB1758_00405 [Candidatus Eremiobacterota bacterium]
MRLILTLLLLAVACLATGSSPAAAVDVPQVTHLRPFSAEANYMSLPGYARYLIYAREGVWLDRAEVVAMLNYDVEAASR